MTDHLATYLRKSALIVAEQAFRQSWEAVVLVGDPRSTSLLASDMPLGHRVTQVDAILDPYLSPAEVLDWLTPTLERVRAERDTELAEQVVDLAGAGVNGVLGLGGTLPMLREGRVGHLLVDPAGPWRATDPEAADGLGDHLIRLALEHGADFTLLDPAGAAPLAATGGIAAILRW